MLITKRLRSKSVTAINTLNLPLKSITTPYVKPSVLNNAIVKDEAQTISLRRNLQHLFLLLSHI